VRHCLRLSNTRAPGERSRSHRDSRNLGEHANNFNFLPGYRSSFGLFLLSSYKWFWNEELDGTFHLDYRSRRGVGAGPELNYHLGRWGDGTFRYYYMHDNDPSANNRRDIYYYSLEGVQDLTPKLYAGIRFSQIFAEEGLPIVGNGNLSEYFFNTLTEEIWRLSLGLGYRWNQNLLVKAEYSFEQGKEVGGGKRNQEDLFAIEAAFKF